ncbi:hypothetical protein BJM58_07495 [Listeria monocytogenes]|uniref:hypothetical protein n=1 Tax=Listeria monocytogenes TaxID=1639 RepID=UPI0008757833|nr:hypothetical protein [Listeria monocytogenes]EAC6121328.1 hypothetical protein [Listeria monocytogenes]EAC9524905.1 hypothetical protein [Listeria monocytogenes]EAD0076742.1 hypothetical protein [Listeria monocytogenes]EAD1771434.1 hypothetical protein [Listeria monocytogenes]EAD5206216.1 hypothetical protein [Listeria monocytogenes]
MHYVESITESVVTRVLELKNESTGTVDLCFDDSAVVSNKNFEFMKQGNSYDCKIKLFGDLVKEKEERTVACLITNVNVRIGNSDFLEVNVKDDVYYIPKEKVLNILEQDIILFKISRKDLIEVNDVIHGDLF